MSVRHDWYQSDSKVVITVLLKNAIEKNYSVHIEREKITMKADNYELELNLYRPIVPENSSHKSTSAKVEISLAKECGERWDSLEMKNVPIVTAPPPIHKQNWDKIAKEVEKSEESEAQSEEALNQLFKKIYSNASPEVQKAMNKSFSESGGTVLSTNWDEVSKAKVDVKPPDGTEFRKWD
ncbi:protein SGT1 homolog [Episyrphus balteatus]|uniref:protein SGT1 homolog n=1 Tax=Episyrphus balteatus TaxID=286459 RepID=UPI0024858B92|nr:protein SGT1 homolog [Episyrphus balteatus]